MLAIDLFCGLGGWTDGLLAENYDVVGFDIERHRYPRTIPRDGGAVKRPGMNWSDQSKRGAKDAMFNLPPEIADVDEWVEYPAQLVLQSVLTLHGSQFKDAALIVASPPCQEFSYMAMPWSKAKDIEREYKSGARDTKKLTALFDACFRIQREAIEAAGHFIPLVVENVRGAQKWVGRSRWNFGSFHLWGDVPALMPMTARARKSELNSCKRLPGAQGGKISGWPHADRTDDGHKVPGFRFDGSGKSFQTASVKVASLDGGRRTDIGKGARFTSRDCGDEGNKGFKDFHDSPIAALGSKSKARKAASAAIAKIPFALAQHIAKYWKPA